MGFFFVLRLWLGGLFSSKMLEMDFAFDLADLSGACVLEDWTAICGHSWDVVVSSLWDATRAGLVHM